MESLRGKVVIITGAGSGIGAALARGFTEEGARVVLVGRRSGRLEKVARECRGETIVVKADVTIPRNRDSIVSAAMARWSRIDILVNNAGMGGYGLFLKTSEEYWRRLFEVNLFAPVSMVRAVLPVMLSQGEGMIINMGSIAGLVAHSDGVCPYVSSKHALLGFSRALARDLSGTGIRILVPCPHITDTEFFDSGPGKEDLALIINQLRDSMDSPAAVAGGILKQLNTRSIILFPTEKPVRAFHKLRDI